MHTLADVKKVVDPLKESGGSAAVNAWLDAHLSELSQELQDQVIFEYTFRSFIEEKIG